MTWRKRVFDTLVAEFAPLHLEVINESPMHGLPESAEKHFRIILVSSRCETLGRIERHRQVNELLAEEITQHIHALSIQAFTPDEWEKKQGLTFNSPPCMGGGKREGVK